MLVPKGNMLPDSGEHFMSIEPSITSIALGDVKVIVFPEECAASTRMSFTGSITGGILSSTNLSLKILIFLLLPLSIV